MRLFFGQINPIVGDLEGNRDSILKQLKQARKENAECVLFPELAISGYPPEDLLLHKEFVAACKESLLLVAEAAKGLTVICGVVRMEGERLYNSAAVIVDGVIEGYHDKVLLPTYDVFDERRYFESGGAVKSWQLMGKKVGITICEDIWNTFYSYERDPVAELQSQEIALLINISASPFSIDKPNLRQNVCAAAAKKLNCPVAICNQVGGNDSLIFDGHSLLLQADGTVIDQLPGFKEKGAMIDSEAAPKGAEISSSIATLHDALVLGIRDYFKKQNFSKVCLGLSGGIDSAVAAALAVKALGPESVLGVAMPSRYSSEGSVTDAQALAKNLGIELWELPIEGPFKEYLKLLEDPFTGTEQGVAEENLQARIRGMLLMAISNKFGHIVLATGNKSEMAMGYTTLYGDAAGGLAILSDVTKRNVYALATYMNRDGEQIPLATIEKPPSAELRPDQKDSDTLPPYDAIDTVLELYVEKMLSPEEIREQTEIEEVVIDRVVKAIHRNEYKRRQIPPGLRVTEKAFSAGRRFPIVQKWS